MARFKVALIRMDEDTNEELERLESMDVDSEDESELEDRLIGLMVNHANDFASCAFDWEDVGLSDHEERMAERRQMGLQG